MPKVDLERIEDRAVGVVDDVTEVPERIHDFADKVNNGLIRLLNDIRDRGGKKAKENLKGQKIGAYGRSAFKWILNNKIVALLGLIIIFLIVRR